MAQILNVPDNFELVCFLPVGIAETEPTLPKKRTFEERAWFNTFPNIQNGFQYAAKSSLLGKFRKYKIGIGEIKMNNKQRKKLKILKYTNEDNIKRIQWKNNILLQECLNNLETYQIISDDAIIRQIVKIASGIEINRRFHSDIPMIEKNHDYYIVWDNERVPIIKCKGNDIIENWDDVLAVAFDTCFVDCESEQGFLIRE